MSAPVTHDIATPLYGDAVEPLHVADAHTAANASFRSHRSPCEILEPAAGIGREFAAAMAAAAKTEAA